MELGCYGTIIAFKNLFFPILGAHSLAVKTGKIRTLKVQFVDEFQKIITKRRKYVSTHGFVIMKLCIFTLRLLAVKVTNTNINF